jgi:CBS domain-containing protein
MNMNKEWFLRQTAAFVVSILFLALGFSALWLLKSMLSMQQDAVLVAMLITPILIYLIMTGRLREISAGGVKAILGEAADEQLSESNTESITAEKVHQIMAEGGGGMPKLQEEVMEIDDSMLLALTVTCNKTELYDAATLLKYLKVLSKYPNFEFLVILRQDKKVIAYMSDSQAQKALETEPQEFVQAINDGDDRQLQRYGAITVLAKQTETYLNVLQKMTDHNMKAIVVVDKNKTLQGVIDREQVLSRLLLAMAR